MKTKDLFYTLFFTGLLSLSFACNPDDDMGPDDTTEPDPDIEFYFNALIDGEPVKLEVTPLSNNNAGISHGGSFGTDTCKIDYGGFVYNFNTDNPSLSADFNRYYVGPCGQEPDVFPDLFQVGGYPFYQEDQPNIPGVEIGYVDESGNYYRSGLGMQSGASFELTESEPDSNFFGIYQKITGTVNCTLYSELGEQLELTEGQFSFHLQSYFN